MICKNEDCECGNRELELLKEIKELKEKKKGIMNELCRIERLRIDAELQETMYRNKYEDLKEKLLQIVAMMEENDS